MFKLAPVAPRNFTAFRNRLFFAASLLTLLLLSSHTARATVAAPRHLAKSHQQGMASWHATSRAHPDRRTAGNRFWNNAELVAAHRTLPLGTRVRVVNLGNNRVVIVEITDRGPYCHGRIIDLSLAAAGRIGMVSSGVARVRLEVLDHGEQAATAVVPNLSGATPNPLPRS